MLLGLGVVFGTATIVVDVGQLYYARQRLQTGTDNAAVAVAEACIANQAPCGSQPSINVATTKILTSIAGGTATVVCGTLENLNACPTPSPKVTACIGPAPALIPYVEVRSVVVVTTTFADTVQVGANTRQTPVHACSRVSVTAATNTTIALTVSDCEVDQATKAIPPGVYGDDGRIVGDVKDAEVALYLHNTDSDGSCQQTAPGGDTPGGFGWLDAVSDAGCSAALEETDAPSEYTASGDTGVNVSQGCETSLSLLRAGRTEVNLPLFSVTTTQNDATGNGTHTNYRITKTAPFVVTGYAMPGLKAASSVSGNNLCKGQEKCLYGYFTSLTMNPIDTILTSGSAASYHLIG